MALVLIAGLGTPAFAGNSVVVVPECGDMYGSAGTQGTDPGSIFLVSQIDGSQIFIGDPTTSGGVSGIAFDNQARLWGSMVFGGSAATGSNLLEINPSDGSLINDVGSILNVAGGDEKVQDLAFDPVSKQLFGTTGNADLVTIDRTTAVATFVGLLPNDPMHIGFAPDGTLWAVDRSSNGDLFTLDPTNANVFTQVARSPADYELDALGVDPSTGIIWAAGSTAPGNGPEINTIDTAGNRVVIGSGLREVADLDFLPCPVKVGGELLPIDSTSLMLAGLQSSAIWMLPVLAGIAGTGFYLIKFRTNKE